MLDEALCERILEIDRPWHITRITTDDKQNRIDIWVALEDEQKNLWFKLGAPTKMPKVNKNQAEGIWQHLGFGDYRTYVHTTIVETPDAEDSPSWTGKKGLPFSLALSKKVLEMFSERLSYRSICSLFNVDFQDVWTTKLSMDKGELHLGDLENTNHLKSSNTPPIAEIDCDLAISSVPTPSHVSEANM